MPAPADGVIELIIQEHRFRNDFLKAEISMSLRIQSLEKRDLSDEVAAAVTSPFQECAGLLRKKRRVHERRMCRLAESLPCWSWVKDVRGVGPLGLAQVIGEAGDLSNYATVSRLWKRMGLAVIDGERQRRVAGAEALKHGYSPQRRSIMFNIGKGLIFQNKEKYREMYDQRKKYEKDKMPPETSKGHIHARAARYMTKKFLRDLWRVWNG